MWPQPLRIESISLHGNQSTETLATKAHWGMQFRHNYVKHVNCLQEGNEMSTKWGKRNNIHLQDTHTYTKIFAYVYYMCMLLIHLACVCVWNEDLIKATQVWHLVFLCDLTKGYLFFYLKPVLLRVWGGGGENGALGWEELHLWQTMINALAKQWWMDDAAPI